jgi:hypothetical protein
MSSIEHLIAQIARLRIDDGDIVLIRCPEIISAETGERIRVYVEHTLAAVGRIAPVMILDRGMSVEILAAKAFRKMPLEQLVTSIEDMGEA